MTDMELRLVFSEEVKGRGQTQSLETHSECYAGGWSRGRRKSGDPVPHDRLARAQPTSLHCLSPGAVGCGHKGPDELWN